MRECASELRPHRRQGEGIAFTPDGSILLVSVGSKKDQPAALSRLAGTLS